MIKQTNKQTNIYFSQSWRVEIQNTLLADLVWWGGAFPGLHNQKCCMWKQKKAGFLTLVRSVILSRITPLITSPNPNYLSKTLLPNTITFMGRDLTYEFWGHKLSVHNSSVPSFEGSWSFNFLSAQHWNICLAFQSLSNHFLFRSLVSHLHLCSLEISRYSLGKLPIKFHSSCNFCYDL